MTRRNKTLRSQEAVGVILEYAAGLELLFYRVYLEIISSKAFEEFEIVRSNLGLTQLSYNHKDTDIDSRTC